MIRVEDDFAGILRSCRTDVRPFTPAALAARFDLPAGQFRQGAGADPIVFYPGASTETAAMLLRGALFWPAESGEQQIVRSHPRILATSDHSDQRHQVLLEPLLAAAGAEGGSGELIAEPKLYGQTVRVYSRGRDLYCATDVSHDGGNPLVGAGIDNSRSLGIDYGSQAARLLSQKYPRIDRLTRLGYTAVFVLQLPELAPDQTVDRADLILVDVVDPDLLFVDRLEKERIAEDYKLSVVDLSARLTLPDSTPGTLLRRCRTFEHQGETPRAAGTIVKGRIGESGDVLFCKVEPSSERQRPRPFTSSDLSAVAEEIGGQFGDAVWTDLRFAEELLLEYLGSHHRSARLLAYRYLADWRAARKLAGLA